MVEANFVGLAAEKDCGAEVVFIEFAGAEESGVFERLQYAEFLEGGPANRFVRCFVFSRDIINADAAGGLRCRVFGLKVLVGEERVLFDQFLENVVAHFPLPLGRADTSFVERLGDSSGSSGIEVVAARGFVAVEVALKKRGDDSGSLVARLAFADAHSLGIGEADADAGCRKENEGLDPGCPVAAKRPLIGQQSGELARFGVCQCQRAIDCDDAAIFVPVPKMAVAGDDPPATLQFEEEDASLGDDKGVDFV